MDGQNDVCGYIEVYVHRRRGPVGPPACVPYKDGYFDGFENLKVKRAKYQKAA